jgi:hypothetical protein
LLQRKLAGNWKRRFNQFVDDFSYGLALVCWQKLADETKLNYDVTSAISHGNRFNPHYPFRLSPTAPLTGATTARSISNATRSRRPFRRMKGYRRIFSRFEKLDALFLGFLSFAFLGLLSL